MSAVRFLVAAGAAVAVPAVAANAALFEVGPGKTYSTIQAAVDAAAALDVGSSGHNTPPADPVNIVVSGGTYTENINIPADATSGFNGLNDSWTVQAAAGERVLVVGGINVGTDRDHLTFDGINVRMQGRSAYYFGQTARNTVVKNAFIFGGGSLFGDGATNFAAINNYRLFGTNTFDHLTIVGNTYGMVHDQSSTSVSTNLIVAFQDSLGLAQSGGNPNGLSYSDVFSNNPNYTSDAAQPAFGPGSDWPDGGNNINFPDGLDPLFASLDPNSPDFLKLLPNSPAAGTGSSAGAFTEGQFNMGALPVVPEPASLSLLGVALLGYRRRR